MSALEGASKYLNNLLLARGLLQDGKRIDFAQYGEDARAHATSSKIINLIHDMVLRRDRESDHHEAIAASIKNMRTTETQYMLQIQQMQDKTQQVQSEMAISQAQERAANMSLKKVERQVKELKEQNSKMKSMLDQVRAKCISDVRKRDAEIEKLKGHLIGLQRGKKDSGGMKIRTLNPQSFAVGREQRFGHDFKSANWTLEKETNDFLAAIVNETSGENVLLRQIIDDTLRTLKEMSGFGDNKRETPEDDGVGIPGQYRKSRQPDREAIVPVDSLSEQIHVVLQHCRTILRDPSFVPIEEVQIREEEIVKLRIGWEKMADRWKEALMMMDQWKQRMMREGKDANFEELSNLSFGRSVATRPDGQPVLDRNHELSMIFEESKIVEGTPTKQAFDEQDEESDLELEPEPASKRLASSPAKRGVKLLRPVQPLGETNGNHIRRDSGISSAGGKSCLNSEDESFKTKSIPENNLTISHKLAAAEAEAEGKAVQAEGFQHKGASRKRKAPSMTNASRAYRRRSTLSPEELAEMMSVR